MTSSTHRTAWLAAGLAILATLAIAVSPAESRPFAAGLSILVLGTVLARWAIGRSAAVIASSPEHFEVELRQPRPTPPEVSGLRSVETDLRMAAANAFGVEFRLKPLLRELATWRLMRNHGVDLDREPEAARRILGEPLWQLTQGAGGFPDYTAPGIPLAELQARVDRLEGI